MGRGVGGAGPCGPGAWHLGIREPLWPRCLLLSPGGPFLPPTSLSCPQREGGADEESAVSRVSCLRHIPGGWAALLLASHQAEHYRVNAGIVCG